MLQRLSAPTGAAASQMEALGINVRDSDGNMKDAASIAGELQSKLSGLDSATRDAAIQTIFGADASRAALVMMNQGTAGIQKYTAATNDQAAAQRLADSQMGDSARKIEEMKGAVETAAIQIGTALALSLIHISTRLAASFIRPRATPENARGTSQDGVYVSYELPTGDDGSWTGLPFVDAVIESHRSKRTVIG